MRNLLWIGSGLLFVGVGLGACGVNTENVCDYPGACGGDAGTDVKVDGSGDTGIDAPPGCDLTKEPKDSLACLADSVGMFVDATNGNDTTGDGSKLKPMQTIGAALGKIGNKPRIYVCEGTYAEDVVLDASHDGVSLYGGWKCADWTYSGAKPVVGKGTLALKVDSAKAAITIADLDVKSADGVSPGESSIAAFVNASDNVTFLRDKLEAGAGKTGDNGTLTSFTYPLQADLDGKNASASTGAPANPVTCPGSKVTTGGKGGDNGFNGDPGLPALGGGTAGTLAACSGSNTGGGKGAVGTTGALGDGAKELGLLNSSGWASSAGKPGSAASPGQGGGGGAGAGGGGGGGGGAGGCGGAPGGNGTGGGGSIGLASLGSTVSVTATEIVATTSGDGGNGVAGQAGQTIFGYGGNKTAGGCGGGSGGAGGDGGSGGGGAGGVSVGVLWKGTAAPTVDASTTGKITVAAKGGAKGLGGATPTNDGIDGVAQAVLEVK